MYCYVCLLATCLPEIICRTFEALAISTDSTAIKCSNASASFAINTLFLSPIIRENPNPII